MNTILKTRIKNKLKKIPLFKRGIILVRVLRNEHSICSKLKLLSSFYRDYGKYRKLPPNKEVEASPHDLFPRIYDKIEAHSIDPVYFYQDAWCAKKIFENKPSRHYDIGSKIDMVSIISQLIPTTMVDLRPIPYPLSGLNFIKGNATELPFKDGEILSLSSICVLEHIGLGRYGDPLDAFGTEKAASEAKRVLAHSGSLYISLPIDSGNRVYFNAHRALTRDYILKLFSPLVLIEEKYIYGETMEDSYKKEKGFGTGLFHFMKK